MLTRKKIFEIVEQAHGSVTSKVYDWFMLVMIVISIGPLTIREDYPIFEVFDKIAVTAFIIDYFLRWITADFRMNKEHQWQCFLLYPITPFAIVDLLSILPSFIVVNKALKLFRITRLFKILRVFKFIRYSKHMQILIRVMQKEAKILMTVGLIALGYIFVTALIMFNIEESAMFEDFFDALYWATTTLTTVGYGDIYPATDLGRIISMISALLGVAIIALPSGVITASYLEELREERLKSNEKKTEENK